METVSVNIKDLKTAYEKANKSGKEMLEVLHGKAMFQTNMMDQVKTFEDACNVLGINPKTITAMSFCGALKAESKALLAQAKLIIIARALNQGWLPNWNDGNECKYYPWFKMGAGFGFSGSFFDGTGSGTNVGSRLYFKTRELSDYAGKKFAGLYKDFLSI
jgi:hypothetical protein